MKNITQEIDNIYKLTMSILRKNLFKIILLLSIIIFVFYFSYLSIIRVYSLNSYYYDLGIMDQVVYNTSRGRILQMTNPTFNQNLSRLAIHFDPILIVFAFFYLFYSHFSVLLFFQVLIVGLGALAIYKLSNLIIKNKLISLLFSLSYLLNFQIQRAVLFDFHAVVLSTTILLWAAYFYEKKNYRPFYFFIFLSLLTKEHLGLIVLFWGVYLFIFRRDFKNAIKVVFLGGGFFVLVNSFVIPYYRGEAHFALNYFSDLGGSTKEIFFNLVKNPMLIIEKIVSEKNWDYHQRLLLGNFYSLFSLPIWLIATPEYLINLLSKNGNMRSYYFHYQSVIVAFSFYSSVLGFKKFTDIFKNKIFFLLSLIIFLLGNIFLYHLYSPLPFFTKQPVKYKIDENKLATIFFWQKKLKNDRIKLVTTPKIAPFFTQRKFYYNFLYDSAFHSLGYSDKEIYLKKSNVYLLADYVIINKDEIKTKVAVKLYDNFLKDKSFHLIYNKNNILVFKKI